MQRVERLDLPALPGAMLLLEKLGEHVALSEARPVRLQPHRSGCRFGRLARSLRTAGAARCFKLSCGESHSKRLVFKTTLGDKCETDAPTRGFEFMDCFSVLFAHFVVGSEGYNFWGGMLRGRNVLNDFLVSFLPSLSLFEYRIS